MKRSGVDPCNRPVMFPATTAGRRKHRAEDWRGEVTENAPSLKALSACARWLSFCLSIGWRRDQLDALEALWWQYHDAKGRAK